MKIDLSEKMLDLQGKEMFGGDSAGRILAHYLMDTSTVNPVRVFKIAMQLLDDVAFVADDEDYKLLVKIIENSSMTNYVKGEILIRLEKDKDGK